MTTIEATFEVTGWDEHQFDRHAGAAKLTQAKVKKTYAGGLEGTSVTEWIMAYGEDGDASFVGIERILGSIDGREGTLVLQHVGQFAGGAAKAELSILTGSCTGDLATLAGRGALVADPAGRITLELDG